MAVTSALHGHNKIPRFPTSAVSRKRLAEDDLVPESQPSDSNNKKVRSKDYSFDKKAVSDKEEWVELMIKELMAAATVDDAKSCAATLLDSLKESLAVVKRLQELHTSYFSDSY